MLEISGDWQGNDVQKETFKLFEKRQKKNKNKNKNDTFNGENLIQIQCAKCL